MLDYADQYAHASDWFLDSAQRLAATDQRILLLRDVTSRKHAIEMLDREGVRSPEELSGRADTLRAWLAPSTPTPLFVDTRVPAPMPPHRLPHPVVVLPTMS